MKTIFTKAALAAGFVALSMSSATAATPDTFYVLGEVNGQTWMYNSGIRMNKDGDKFTIAVRTNKTDSYFSFCKNLSSVSWDDLNVQGNRWGAENDGTAAVLNSPLKVTDANANAYAFKISEQGTYTFTVDFSNPSNVTLTVTEGGTPDPVIPPDPVEITEPDKLYLLGDIPGHHWEANYGVEMTKNGHVFTGTADIETAFENDYGFFSFCTVLGDAADAWDAGVNTGNRFGPAEANSDVEFDTGMPFTLYAAGVNASACTSWRVAPGEYNIVVNFTDNTITVSKKTGVEAIETEESDAVYYNLQGVRAASPGRGVYIRVAGSKASKVFVK